MNFARDGMVCEEYNQLASNGENVKEAWVTEQLRGTEGTWFLQQIMYVLIANRFVAYLPRQPSIQLWHWVQMVMVRSDSR